jgi:hypothetical protein
MKRFDGSDFRCFCSPNLITVMHENVLKPIHTVYVGKEIRMDVLHELPVDASQPLRRRIYFKIGQARIVLKCVNESTMGTSGIRLLDCFIQLVASRLRLPCVVTFRLQRWPQDVP